jgi:hypothetical protein
VRVTDPQGHETEVFPAALGRVTVIGAGTMSVREFYNTYRVLGERRDGERRVTRERRKRDAAGRRYKTRRRVEHLTALEIVSLCLGIEHTV